MTRRAPALAPFALAALSLPLGSCLGPELVFTAGLSAAQAGVSEFSKGRLRTAWDAPIHVMLDAVRDSLESLGFEPQVVSTTGEEWHVEAEQLDGTGIDVYLTTITERVTLVSIRVGVFGDQPLSKLIADRIDTHISRWEEEGDDTTVVPGGPAPAGSTEGSRKSPPRRRGGP